MGRGLRRGKAKPNKLGPGGGRSEPRDKELFSFLHRERGGGGRGKERPFTEKLIAKMKRAAGFWYQRHCSHGSPSTPQNRFRSSRGSSRTKIAGLGRKSSEFIEAELAHLPKATGIVYLPNIFPTRCRVYCLCVFCGVSTFLERG